MRQPKAQHTAVIALQAEPIAVRFFLLPNTAPRPVESGWLTEMNISTGLQAVYILCYSVLIIITI